MSLGCRMSVGESKRTGREGQGRSAATLGWLAPRKPRTEALVEHEPVYEGVEEGVHSEGAGGVSAGAGSGAGAGAGRGLRLTTRFLAAFLAFFFIAFLAFFFFFFAKTRFTGRMFGL